VSTNESGFRSSAEPFARSGAAGSDTTDPRTPRGAGSARAKVKSRPADRIFFGLSFGAATLILVILAAVALFLIIQAIPAIVASWQHNPDLSSGPTAGYSNFWSYVGPLIWGTLFVSAIALIIGAPIAIGIALFISHYAPRRLAGILGYLIDLLAAVPSIVFGLWGIIVIRPLLLPLTTFLNHNLGWFPLFGGAASTTGSTILAGAVVLAVMILPIISSISREIFLQTPRLHEEAALALGATKWEMIKMAVLPYARSGVVSATLLGLGRALGETMAIALIISPSIQISWRILTESQNSQTIAANIALNFQVANGLQREALIGTGLMLFVISLGVNILARFIIGRTGPGTGSKRKTKPARPSVAATSAPIESAALSMAIIDQPEGAQS
jgi:phosphate transport system permease protein